MGAAAAEANARREHERAALLATQAQAVLERTALLHKAARRRLTAATWLMVLSLAVAVGVLISLYTGGLHR